MKDSRINYILVGSFVLVALAGLILALALVSGRGGAMDAYHIVYENVTGVVPGTEVLFEGYGVGRVAGVSPLRTEEGHRFRVDVKIRKGWPLPEDSVAEITAPGLLAAFAIEIHAGHSANFLEPGSEINSQAPTNVFSAVSGLAGDLRDLLRNSIEPVLEGLASSTPEILENLESLSGQLALAGERLGAVLDTENTQHVSGILSNFHSTAMNVETVSGELTATQQELHQLLTALNRLVAQNEGNVEHGLADLHYALEAVTSRIDAISYNLEGTTRNLSEFSHDIRQNPGLLLRGRSEGDEDTQ